LIGAVLSKPKARILIVDDDISILKGFRSILEREGYSVETAETGKEATEKIENEKFNVYLVDVRLPDMDGTELLLKNQKTVKQPESS
jgi:two-component system, OmpR family, alkaline phosphatase synthesis response regulator PhoP